MKPKTTGLQHASSLLATLAVFFASLGISCSIGSTSTGEVPSLGNPVIKTIENRYIESFTVTLEKGTFLGLAVEQYDVDVITDVFGPDGMELGKFDTPTSGRGVELIRIGADVTGDYQVDVSTLSDRAEPGEFKLSITDYRPITDRDKRSLEAVRLHQDADELRAKTETRAASIPLYENALQIWRELGERTEEANVLRAMGFAYQRTDDLEKAWEHFGKALEIWDSTGDLRSAAFTHVIFGVISKKRNDPQAGLEHDLMAQPLWEQSGDVQEYTQNLVRIGNDYIKLQNNTEALNYFQKALEYSKRSGKKSIEAYVQSECGNAQLTVGNKAEALQFYREALEIWKSLNQKKAAAGVEEKIAKLTADS